jgi:hypothetical protein
MTVKETLVIKVKPCYENQKILGDKRIWSPFAILAMKGLNNQKVSLMGELILTRTRTGSTQIQVG